VTGVSGHISDPQDQLPKTQFASKLGDIETFAESSSAEFSKIKFARMHA
jgi:hypothetical protein